MIEVVQTIIIVFHSLIFAFYTVTHAIIRPLLPEFLKEIESLSIQEHIIVSLLVIAIWIAIPTLILILV